MPRPLPGLGNALPYLKANGLSEQWNESIWRELVDAAPDAHLVVDREGAIVYVNAQTEKLFGFTRAELFGQPIECLVPDRFRAVHADQRDSYSRAPKLRPMGTGKELYGQRKDGSEFPVEISLSPIKSGNSQLITAAIRDITTQKAAEEALTKARETAEAANRSKSEFLANMSHEIRTPLAGIVGYAQMIALYCHNDEDRKDYVAKIQSCTHTLTALIDDILDLSKVEAGALNIESLPISVAAEVDNVLNLLQARADEKKIQLQVIYERPLPAQIISDPTRVRQILVNVIGNGIKFTEKGSVILRIGQNKTNIQFSITDTGCGLSREEQGRLFQSFAQADSSTTRRFGGTGLGLALSRKLARALGGELEIKESAPGRGSTFVLTLPQDQAALKIGSVDGSNLVHSPKQPLPSLQGYRVLIAEDNPDNRALVARFLQESGAETTLAVNGLEALELAKANKYSAILMDMQMPVMDGYDATQRLRSERISTPVIALTAHAMNGEKEKCLSLGCQAFLTKPIDVEILVRKVHEVAAPKAHIPVLSDKESDG